MLTAPAEHTQSLSMPFWLKGGAAMVAASVLFGQFVQQAENTPKPVRAMDQAFVTRSLGATCTGLGIIAVDTDTIKFDVQATRSNGDLDLDTAINFGDGTTSEPEPLGDGLHASLEHEYTIPGTYTAEAFVVWYDDPTRGATTEACKVSLRVATN